MAGENILHVKFEFQEALQSKKDLLSSQINLLRTSKAIKNYKSLRSQELNQKAKLLKKIKSTKTNIGKLKRILPKVKIPDILKDGHERKELEDFKTKNQEVKDRSNIESQLRDIQEKLTALSK